ncbi:MAG TPA: diacylglycerol kinase family protein [Dehalococcoidia bacterium]|nr:diacylglycerol kinase family protein [Dehalococcoidia bacterium]
MPAIAPLAHILPLVERACIVYNPAARNAPGRERLTAAAAAMKARGWEIELQATEAAGHGIVLAREAVAAGAGVVFSCGGDGTVNEVVNGLAGSPAALGVLRGGMGDVFGKEAGIPRAPEEALRVLTDGVRCRFDLGLAGERYFLLMAGIGFDASVVQEVPSGAKRRLGSTSYALWGLMQLARYRSKGTLLRVDGIDREARLYWLLLGNTRSYGGVINVTSEALVNDGLLDAFLFEGRTPGWLIKTVMRLATRRHNTGEGVTFQRIREVEVTSIGLPVQVDGEYIGETPMRFAIAPSMLDVLLPRGKAEALWGGS